MLGVVVRDRVDNDFRGIVIGRDQKGRFRFVATTCETTSQRRAEALLRRAMEAEALLLPRLETRDTGREARMDFFSPVVQPEQFADGFRLLLNDEGYSPAREIIEAMMYWFDDPDGNFIEQFQSTGFDARIWELYLFAALSEMDYKITRPRASPDFFCRGLSGGFFVEATTVNPTRGKDGKIMQPPILRELEDIDPVLQEYMPIKFGSALISKLRRRYWEHEHVKGNALVLAIADFSSPGSLLYSRTALLTYLYGYRYKQDSSDGQSTRLTPKKVPGHRWDEKEIPSGFFDLPDAENISAVLYSNSGTIAKFSRMGLLAGFGSDRVSLVRASFEFDPSPGATRPRRLRKLVKAPSYQEAWADDIEVFHNPRATVTLAMELLPGLVHYQILEDGRLVVTVPPGSTSRTLASVTEVHVSKGDKEPR